jgi:hypothetical protein
MKDLKKLESDILDFVRDSYPEMQVRAEAWIEDPKRTALYFVEPKFALIYPAQRYHYLDHLIPADYQEKYLAGSIWFELAPGEKTADLQYPDEELIEEITPDVMKCLSAAQVFEALDDRMYPSDGSAPRAVCWGDYRTSRPLLLETGFTEEELFEVFHVLMAQGGYCDCEILFHVAKESRFAAEYWRSRANLSQATDSHQGHPQNPSQPGP